MMTKSNPLTLSFLVLLAAAAAEAFVGTTPATRRVPMALAMDPSHVLESGPMLLATIDADIAKIDNNEFRTVFAGGMAVMLGGLLSVVAVGTMIDANDSYASIVVDSYIQAEDDEDFWKNLSAEETVKVKELMQRRKAGKRTSAETLLSDSLDQSSSSSDETASAPVPTIVASKDTETKAKKDIDMFSDY